MKAGAIAVTVDLDWAGEGAIAGLLDYLDAREIPVTVFVTHHSPTVVAHLDTLEVGLHPHFGPDSSHGMSVPEVVRSVLELRHNLAAFRCHRFAVSNEVNEAMAAAGMRISSNVCADLSFVPPFRHRSGLLEIPIFLEDGGYLSRGHSLDSTARIDGALAVPGTKVLLLHPMHFAVNTPHFDFMVDIKRSLQRTRWNALSAAELASLRFPGRGIRDLIMDVLDAAQHRGLSFTTLGAIAREDDESRAPTSPDQVRTALRLA